MAAGSIVGGTFRGSLRSQHLIVFEHLAFQAFQPKPEALNHLLLIVQNLAELLEQPLLMAEALLK